MTTINRRRLGFLLAVVLLGLNLRTVVASLPPLVSTIRDDLGLSATVAGLLTTLPVLCFGLLAGPARRLPRRFTLEALLVAAMLVTAAAAGLRGIGTPAALFAGSLLAGASVAVGQVMLPVLIRVAHPDSVGLLMGGFSMALTLGSALGAGLAVPLDDALDGSWSGSLAIWAVPAALTAGVWLPLALRRRTRVAGSEPEPLRGQALAWAVALYFGVQSAAFYATLSWLPEILVSEGWSGESGGAILALVSLVSMVPAFALPAVAARRMSQQGLVIVMAATSAVGIAGLLLASSLAPVWAVLMGLGQGGTLGLGLILPVLRAGTPAAVAALTSMTLSVGYIIAAMGPWLMGVAHDLTSGWTGPLVLLLALTLAQLLPGLPAARARQLGHTTVVTVSSTK
jgi:MFS transporter, CP family, cyanate transporter